MAKTIANPLLLHVVIILLTVPPPATFTLVRTINIKRDALFEQ